MPARHTIEAAARRTVKVRFDPERLREFLPVEDGASAESMWVEPFWHHGDIWLGYLRNDAFEFPLTHGDLVAYADFPEYKACALDCYHQDDFTRQAAIADVEDRLDEFIAAAQAELTDVESRLSCRRCGDPEAYGDADDARGVWMVTDAAWAHVPKRYRDTIICKKCFKELTGLDAKEYSRFDQDGNVIREAVIGAPSDLYPARSGEHVVAAAVLDQSEDDIYLGAFHREARDLWKAAHPDEALEDHEMLDDPDEPGLHRFKEGFYTSTGRFVDRKDAQALARRERQTRPGVHHASFGLDSFDVVPDDAHAAYRARRTRSRSVDIA